MSQPRFLPCACGHTKDWHERAGLAPQCSHTGCTCLRYRPLKAVAPSSSVPTVQPPRTTTPSPPRAVEQRADRPATPDHHPIAARGERGPTIEQILQAGKRSAHPRTVRLTEKIAEQIHDLRGRLTDERDAAERKARETEQREAAKAEVARLEAELREARAKLRGGAPVPSPAEGPQSECPDCGKPFRNVGSHRARAHGYRAAAG